MRAFIAPYEIHFDDTMAYGSHHFMTGFRLQCAGRERLLFSDALFREPGFRADFDDVILYTAEAYSMNLGPANLGDRLVVVTTVEERTRIGLRFCFRALNERGEPVCVGFQTVICASRDGDVVAFPASFDAAFDRYADIVEPWAAQTFRERVLRGGKHARGLFSPDICAWAREHAAGSPAAGVAALGSPRVPPRAERVLLLGGQGCFDAGRLAALIARQPEAGADLTRAAAIVAEQLGKDLTPLLRGETDDDELVQVGILLSGALAAREAGPVDLVLGHSFGELPALVAAGVWDLPTGVAAVCARVLALRPDAGRGGLAAVGLDEAGTRRALLAFPALRIAGRNHDRQTVVSGPQPDLLALRDALAAVGAAVTLVPSPHPFHHPALADAAARFGASLAALPAHAPRLTAWSAIDGAAWTGEPVAIAERLAGHLVRPFDLLGALRALRDAGASTFLDATGGRLGRVVTKALGEGVRVVPVDVAPAQAAPSPIAAAAPPSPAAAPPRVADAPAADDVAIVAMGCMFPAGATDPDAFWRALKDGAIGVREDASLDADFVSRTLRPDKALTTLAGRVDDACLPAVGGRSRIQRLLAHALTPCATVTARVPAERVAVLLGATADGSDAFDDALATDALAASLPAPYADAVRRVLPGGDPAAAAPHAALAAVVNDVIGPVATTLVDAACASSLYTLALGAAMLRAGEVDVVLAGGAFSPGPGNNALFSQFRGLSTTGIRPFDASADGVVFGEGAGVLALKRLADAVRDGDVVHAVVRGVGLSSDGRSSSANVPRAEGQLLAIERAWQGLDPRTTAFIEAHGTATPAGDATELRALGRFFVDHKPPVGSLKAHTGHLGWVAGTASLIKLCLMLRHGELVRQHTFTTPGKALTEAGFSPLTADRPWPAQPTARRACTSGFGFGGTDAHVVVEEHLPGPLAPARGAATGPLAVVAAHGVLPAGARLGEHHLRLPEGLRVLPDLVDDMDPTQRLAVAGVHALLGGLGVDDLRPTTALVLALEGKTTRAIEALQRVLADRTDRLLRDAEARGAAPAGAAAAARARTDALRPSTAYTLQGMMPNVTPGRVANLLDLQGPNFVVDQGRRSFAAAIDQAAALLRLGADLVVAGGVHVGATVADGDTRPPAGDGLALLALTTPELAAARGLRVLALLDRSATQQDAPVGPLDRRGAEGGAAVLDAVARAAAGAPTSVVLPGGARLDVRPAAPAPRDDAGAAPTTQASSAATTTRAAPQPAADAAPKGFGSTAAVRYATPTLAPRAPTGTPTCWADRRVIALGDAAVASALTGRGASVLHVPAADLREEADAAELLAAVAAHDADAVVISARLHPCDLDRALVQATSDRALLDTAFLTLRTLYPALTADRLDVLALHLGGVLGDDLLHPATGLLAGMLKSVAREAPAGRVRVVHTDHHDVELALDHAAAELSDDRQDVVEAAWRQGQRAVRILRAVDQPSAGPSPLGPDSVVLATGGAKGVTAVLVEELLRRHGCTVVLVGRSTVDGVPASVLAADEAGLDALEASFYAEQARPGVKLADLRRTFARWRSAHELHHTLAHLSALPGQVRYVAADVTDAAAIDAVVGAVADEHGRLDLVVHGAGLQTSKKLDRRALGELRRNMDVKLAGLRALRAACLRHVGDVPVHALTSAFSFFGNDGQADYGAANETLDRLCAMAAARPGSAPWTSIGWLAWDRVGMTRSPEYAVLGAARNLRGVTPEEGAALFAQVVEGRPAAAVFHQLTDGEVAWYGLEVQPAPADPARDLAALPCLNDHLVRGTPTVPGAWTLDRLVPDDIVGAPVIAAEDITFTRFVRMTERGLPPLRITDAPRGRRTLVGDVVHASGTVLQADVPHASAVFSAHPSMPARALEVDGGVPTTDPYTDERSPIGLGGAFRCLHDIRVGPNGRSARFSPTGPQGASRLPAMLLDAAWRLSAMRALGPDSDVVHAPVSFGRAVFRADATALDRPLTLVATPPRVDGDVVRCDRVEAVDDLGRVVLVVEGGLARRIP